MSQIQNLCIIQEKWILRYVDNKIPNCNNEAPSTNKTCVTAGDREVESAARTGGHRARVECSAHARESRRVAHFSFMFRLHQPSIVPLTEIFFLNIPTLRFSYFIPTLRSATSE